MEEKEFKALVSQYAGADEFVRVLEENPTSFRVNTLRLTPEEFLRGFPLECRQVEWLDYAFTCKEKIGNTLEHACGYAFSQSLSSMLPSLCLNPLPGEEVLDSCAAPGAKTTHLSQLMNNEGAIMAVDARPKRMKSLVANCRRWGSANVACLVRDATQLDGRERFDKVLVDAPCSCLGTRDGWKGYGGERHDRLQLLLALAGYRLLKKGGQMVYSTCTITEAENEGVVASLLGETDAKLVDAGLPLKTSRGLAEYGKEFQKVKRVYPQEINSEAFFVAKVEKP